MVPESVALLLLAQRINDEHQQCATAVRAGLQHAMAAGALLREARSLVPHGQWGSWLREHCHVSERTAQAYMQVARQLPARLEAEGADKSAAVADLTLREALQLVAEHPHQTGTTPQHQSTPDLPEPTPVPTSPPGGEVLPAPAADQGDPGLRALFEELREAVHHLDAVLRNPQPYVRGLPDEEVRQCATFAAKGIASAWQLQTGYVCELVRAERVLAHAGGIPERLALTQLAKDLGITVREVYDYEKVWPTFFAPAGYPAKKGMGGNDLEDHRYFAEKLRELYAHEEEQGHLCRNLQAACRNELARRGRAPALEATQARGSEQGVAP